MKPTYIASLLALSLLIGCSSSEPKKKEDKSASVTKKRASDYVAGYDGRPVVRRVDDSKPPTPGAPAEAAKSIPPTTMPRFLVYVTDIRSFSNPVKSFAKTGAKKTAPTRAGALVFTDGSARDFKKNYKKTDFRSLKGTVKPVDILTFDKILAELQLRGFNRLQAEIHPSGLEAVGHARALHLQIGNQRRSYYKINQPANGTKNSARAAFTKCEQYMVYLYYPMGKPPPPR